MRRILFAAAISLGVLGTAQAQTTTIGGAVAGGLAGAIIAGPIGLVVGGVTGGIVGNNMERPRRTVCYVNDRGREVCRPR